ncbi:hypothetical protein ONZ45_g4554 [Pleurotus djamor]|nr:hypothetical protein ONZ45_g4554 [Pleurotus djamor]
MAAVRVETAAELATHGAPPPAPVQTESYRLSHYRERSREGLAVGGKDLGCPTANLPDESIEPLSSVARTGVYYGYAQVIPTKGSNTNLREADIRVLPMVMSLGWNPFYGNKQLTAEIHIMHDFASDFYGLEMRAVVLGYIRPELDYTSREALIEDIETDKRVAIKSLQRPAYQTFEADPHFTSCASNL